MSKKHIYVNGRPKDVIAYRDSENFKMVPDYPYEFKDKVRPFEYGMLELADCYIHFLVGNLPRKGCLYCGAPMKIEQNEKKLDFGEIFLEFTLLCTNCTGRGRSLRVRESLIKDPEIIDLVKERLEYSQKYPRSWFDDFENPWEKD